MTERSRITPSEFIDFVRDGLSEATLSLVMSNLSVSLRGDEDVRDVVENGISEAEAILAMRGASRGGGRRAVSTMSDFLCDPVVRGGRRAELKRGISGALLGGGARDSHEAVLSLLDVTSDALGLSRVDLEKIMEETVKNKTPRQ